MPFLAPLLALIPGKAYLYVAVAIGALIVVYVAVKQHDARVLAEHTVAEQAAQMKQADADHAKAVAALEQVARDAEARAAASAQTRSKIHAAPSTSACAGSPAIGAVIDGLRGAGRSAGQAPGAAR